MLASSGFAATRLRVTCAESPESRIPAVAGRHVARLVAVDRDAPAVVLALAEENPQLRGMSSTCRAFGRPYEPDSASMAPRRF